MARDRKEGEPTPLARTPLAMRRLVEEKAKRQEISLEQDYLYTNALAFHPSGRWIVAGRFFDLVVIDLAESRFDTYKAHKDTLSALAFDAAGERLVSVGWDGAVGVWDFAARTCALFEDTKNRIHSVALTSDGTTAFMVGHEAMLVGIDLATKRRTLVREGHRLYCSAVALSKDESLLISSDSAGDLRIWDRGGNCLRTLVTRAPDPAEAITYWPVSIRVIDADRVLMACRLGTALIFNLKTYKIERSFAGGHTKSMEDAILLERAGLVVTCSEDCCLSVWDANPTEGDGLLLTFKAHAKQILQLAVAPDQRTFASFGQEGIVKIWDVKTIAMAAREPAKLTLIAKATCEACGAPLRYVDAEAHQIEVEQLACDACGGMYDLASVGKKKKRRVSAS